MAIWKGSISFGLVNIPCRLETAQESDEKISFQMEDSEDHSPVGYKYYNKSTGEDVPRDRIIKTYEYEKGKKVEITKEDLASINKEGSDNVEIKSFVPLSQIDPLLFEKPYYLVPQKGAEKSYLLLMKAMAQEKACALGEVTLRSRNRLALMFERDGFLFIELLRYPHTVILPQEAPYKTRVENIKLPKGELDMAKQLLKSMQGEWTPEDFKDNYYRDLKKLIDKKVKGKQTHEAKEVPKERGDDNVKDIMPLLRKSLEKSKNEQRKRA